jgi:hypothetical protein
MKVGGESVSMPRSQIWLDCLRSIRAGMHSIRKGWLDWRTLNKRIFMKCAVLLPPGPGAGV